MCTGSDALTSPPAPPTSKPAPRAGAARTGLLRAGLAVVYSLSTMVAISGARAMRTEATRLPPGGAPAAEDRACARASIERRLGEALVLAGAVRVFLLLLPAGFRYDVHSFIAWARRLVEVGIPRFYDPAAFCDYPPLYLYVLYLLGKVYEFFDPGFAGSGGRGFTALLKVPPVAADLACAYLIYRILRGRVSARSAYLAALAYALNPLPIFVSAVWGQIDSVLILVMLATVKLLLEGRLVLAAGATAAAVLVKPQGLFLVPLVLASQARRQSARAWAGAGALALVTTYAVVRPFRPGAATLVEPFAFLFDAFRATAATYTSSSVSAFNVWALAGLEDGLILWGERFADARALLGVEHRTIGLAALGVLLALVASYLVRERRGDRVAPTLLAGAAIFLGIFVLATRMHERYVMPAVALLALASGGGRASARRSSGSPRRGS